MSCTPLTRSGLLIEASRPGSPPIELQTTTAGDFTTSCKKEQICSHEVLGVRLLKDSRGRLHISHLLAPISIEYSELVGWPLGSGLSL